MNIHVDRLIECIHRHPIIQKLFKKAETQSHFYFLLKKENIFHVPGHTDSIITLPIAYEAFDVSHLED